MTNNQYSIESVRNNVLAYYMTLEARTTMLKAQSNLRPNPEFDIPNSTMKRGLLGLVRNTYAHKQQPMNLWLGMVLAAAYPDKATSVSINDLLKDGATQKRLRKAVRDGVYAPSPHTVSLVRRSDSFAVTVEFARCEVSTLRTLFNMTTNERPEEPDFGGVPFQPTDTPVSTMLMNPKRIIKAAAIPGVQQMLEACTTAIDVSTNGNVYIFQITFKVTKEQAQYMTNKRWETVRPVDLHAVFSLWVRNSLGIFGDSPAQVFALSTVSRTLPKDPSVLNVKVNDQQLTCSHDGKPLFILKQCDNTAEYEAALTRAGNAHADGTFALSKIGDAEPPDLPINKPILTDWLNCKFAYTNTAGQLAVQNLTNCRAANSVHISTWLKRAPTDQMFKRVFNLAMSGSSATFNVKASDFDNGVIPPGMDINDLVQYTNQAIRTMGATVVTWGDFAFNSEYEILRPIGRYFQAVYRDIIANVDPVFQRYSVEHTMAVLPYIILMGYYAPKAGQISAEANAINAPAINQKGTPAYEPEAPELWSGDCGLQPHQRRIAEKLSGSPAFGILPVPAGGGKTPVIIFDILTQMHKGIGAPYLIMCPSHLVAQYLKEINFFTKGRLNVIPINTRVYNIHGEKRLTSIVENAPRNTVVVCDYDVLKQKAVNVCYGVENATVFPIADMLKQFNFGYVALDESHYVKNPSARTRAVMGLIADIPMKRLASGTMSHDSPSDLASQIAMMDPTIFGSKDNFNERFGAEFKGSRVVSWKPGYESEVKRMIRERIVDAGAHRREWAALLPPADEAIHPVEMTEAQRAVYESILKETIEEIKKNASLSKRLAEDKATAEDDDDEEDIVAQLQPYIARLEQFICAPDKDVVGNKLLRGEDRISPKVHEINQMIAEHIDGGRPGKILIFTNYQLSAEHIFENLLPRFQKMAIHYHAADKVEDGATFENDDRKRILVGVETSLNTGLNLQFCALLIRVETVWNPGTLEQGNSRINRPSLKVKDKRDAIYYRWIVCDASIDVTKMSRLTAKAVTVAKFENENSPEYKALPDLPIIPLNLETIATDNSWNGTLRQYGMGYRDYRQLVRREYMQYKKEFTEKYGDEVMKFPGDGGTSQDSALADNVPWVPGLEIAAETNLNLIRVDQYLRLEATAFESEDDSDDKAIEDNSWRKSMANKLLGQDAFCEFGQGKIVGVALRVGVLQIRVGTKVYHRVRFAAAYVFGKPLKISVRKNQMKFTGMSLVETTTEQPVGAKVQSVKVSMKEIEQKVDTVVKDKKKKRRERVVDMSVNLEMVSTNGFLGLRIIDKGVSDDALDVLSAHGFSPELPSRRAWMKTGKMLNEQMWLWVNKGFGIVPEMVEDGTLGAFETLMEMLKSKQISQDKLLYKFVTKQQLRNFYRYERKPVKSRKMLMIYPVVEDGKAYIYMPMRGQSGNRTAIRYRAPGVIWQETPAATSWFGTRPQHIKNMLHTLQDAGIVLKNKAALEKQYQKLRKAKARKNVNMEDVDQAE